LADTDGDGVEDARDGLALDHVVFYHGDHLGSTTVLTNAEGEPLARLVYEPFGEAIAPPGSPTATVPTFGFTGQRFEAALGLYDYGVRWYDPALARFLSADSLVPEPGDPQSLNRYSYVRNNPLSRIDPDGSQDSIFGDGASSFFFDPFDFFDYPFGYGQRTLFGLLRSPFDLSSYFDDLWARSTLFDRSIGGLLFDDFTTSLVDTASSAARFFGGSGWTREDAYAVTDAFFGAATGGTLLSRRLTGPRSLRQPLEAQVGLAEVARGGGATLSQLESAASRALQEIGSGRGPAYGTRAHAAFERQVNTLGRADLTTEVSYLSGRIVPRGTPGSVRLDVVEGPLTNPTSVFDLKTGGAVLTSSRVPRR
jgi:RHS repeat-associated protein